MECPICHKAMKQKSSEESVSSKNNARYERIIYVCEQDDVWLTSEIPKPTQPAKIIYTNWRGETAERSIVPVNVWFGATEWHKDEQWLLRALDTEKAVERDFALKDIQNWL